MNSQDIVLISPMIAGVLTAAAILIVDLIRPGKPSVAVGVALAGLAVRVTGRPRSARGFSLVVPGFGIGDSKFEIRNSKARSSYQKTIIAP